MNKNLISVIIIGIILAATGFFGGIKYQQAKQPSFNRQFATNGQGRTDFNRQADFRPVSGEIISLSDQSLTVKLQDGSSKIIFYSDSTKINQTTEGSKTDLQSGASVTIIGTTNSDGSVTAQSISLGSSFPGGMMRFNNP